MDAGNCPAGRVDAVFEGFVPFDGLGSGTCNRFTVWNGADCSWRRKQVGKELAVHVVLFCLRWGNLQFIYFNFVSEIFQKFDIFGKILRGGFSVIL